MVLSVTQPDFDVFNYEVAQFVSNKDGDIYYGFFGRNGGVSKDVYATLNCGRGSDDKIESVKKNLQIIAGEAGVIPEKLLTLHQVHSADCIVVEKPWGIEKRPEVDAAVTDKAGIALGVLTADCAPVLFSGSKEDGSSVVGAAHAGWKGALGGILETTVQKMLGLGAIEESITAAIGPCISQKSYEVSEPFLKPFLDEDKNNERFFKSSKNEGHYMFDLPGYCAFKLSKIGLRSIYIKDVDTYFNEEDFFSYRRATHRNEKDYGRQISVISIKASE